MNNKQFYIISAIVYFLQGWEGLPGTSLFFFLKEQLHYTPEKIMLLGSVISVAWVIKPLWGFIADNYLNKKSWIIFSLIGSIVVSLFFGLSPIMSIPLIILFALFGNIQSALRDVAVDGEMCSNLKEDSNKIQSVQWVSITIASIIVGLGGGYIADHFSYRVAYLCLIPAYVIAIYFCSKYKSVPKEIIQKQSFIDNVKSYVVLFKDKRFLFACLFLALYKFSPSFGTPLSFIERDVFKWNGMTMGIIGAISSTVSIIGAIVFYKINEKINIKKWLYISVFLGALTSLAYLYYTPITAILYSVTFSVVGMFIHLIVMGLLAKSTIKGKEATSFALLCSVNNLAAGTLSSFAGAWLYPLIGLKWLIILSALTSFACLPLIKKLNIK